MRSWTGETVCWAWYDLWGWGGSSAKFGCRVLQRRTRFCFRKRTGNAGDGQALNQQQRLHTVKFQPTSLKSTSSTCQTWLIRDSLDTQEFLFAEMCARGCGPVPFLQQKKTRQDMKPRQGQSARVSTNSCRTERYLAFELFCVVFMHRTCDRTFKTFQGPAGPCRFTNGRHVFPADWQKCTPVQIFPVSILSYVYAAKATRAFAPQTWKADWMCLSRPVYSYFVSSAKLHVQIWQTCFLYTPEIRRQSIFCWAVQTQSPVRTTLPRREDNWFVCEFRILFQRALSSFVLIAWMNICTSQFTVQTSLMKSEVGFWIVELKWVFPILLFFFITSTLMFLCCSEKNTYSAIRERLLWMTCYEGRKVSPRPTPKRHNPTTEVPLFTHNEKDSFLPFFAKFIHVHCTHHNQWLYNFSSLSPTRTTHPLACQIIRWRARHT